ncbi:MAG TPA: aminotransferase class IV [Vicinamibacterales bacterium]|jgi:branched-chain amino acid aminotransferase
MAAIINVNGRITTDQDAVVSVLDHGFLYGEGVYEVVRTYGRKPFLFDRHLDRLRRSAAFLSLALPFTDVEFEARVRQTTDAFFAQPDATDDVYVRFMVTRGVGEMNYNPAACLSPTVVVIAKPFTALAPEVYAQGVRAALVPVLRNHPGSVSPMIKSNNLLNNALAAQEAYRRGAFEGIMRNYRNEISEGSISNIFVVKGGIVSTPPLDAGLLAGITRAFVLEIAPAAAVTIRETTIHDSDLLDADECFLTSSTQEIVPIVKVDDRVIGDGRPGRVTRQLHAQYQRRLREMLSV